MARTEAPRGAFELARALTVNFGGQVVVTGAFAAERRAELPGDELVPDPGLVLDHAVTIDAPSRALGLEGWGAFVVRPDGPGRSRLIIRGRIDKGLPTLVYRLILPIPHFVMQRKMLLGIKRRAEAMG